MQVFIDSDDLRNLDSLSRAECSTPANGGKLGCTPRGFVRQDTLQRRVLRKVLETAFEKVLRGIPKRCLGTLKIASTVLKGFESHKILAPVLVIISGNSLVFSRKIIASTDFYQY